MKKISQLVKEKKYLLIFLCLALIFIVMFISALKEMFFADSGNVYGDRLDGIKDFKITDDVISEAKNSIMISEKVETIKVEITGRLVNFIITVKPGTDIIDSKQLSEKSLEFFDDDQKQYYDFQYFLIQKNDEENDLYPIIGTKHKSRPVIVWTK